MLNKHLVPVNPTAKASLAAVKEVDAVVLNVEPNHITTEHTLLGKNIMDMYFKSINRTGPVKFHRTMGRFS